MQTQITTVSLAFPPTKQYAIPSYQRNYVWTREGQWEPLWEDVKALTDQVLVAGPDAKPHFLGTIITRVVGLDSFITRWWVVDGQQRLTTLQILIAAARTAFIAQGLDGYASMLSGLLANETEFVRSPRHKYKIEHKSRDYAGFASIIDAAPISHAQRRWRVPIGPLLHLLPEGGQHVAALRQRRRGGSPCRSLHHGHPREAASR